MLSHRRIRDFTVTGGLLAALAVIYRVEYVFRYVPSPESKEAAFLVLGLIFLGAFLTGCGVVRLAAWVVKRLNRRRRRRNEGLASL